MRTRPRNRALTGLLLSAALGLGACGGTTDDTLRGAVIEPAPDMSAFSLPHAVTGEPVALRAPDGEVRLVYFGFTLCPDVCPTSLAHVKAALRRIGEDKADKVSLVFATVDPTRDSGELLEQYVGSFVERSTPLRTEDDTELREVADAFGVQYSVTTNNEGIVEVAHTGTIYAVDDEGRLAVQWPFDADPDEADVIAHDLEVLLDRT